jgi:chloramphenicol-sensitive protein RarD
MVVASVVWGLSPLYYKFVAHVPPLEVLCHRTIWSLVLFGVILALQKRFSNVLELLAKPHSFLLVAFAAFTISINWFVYIYSVQIGRLVESSLGYYMFPLVAVLLGMSIFGERLSVWKWVSVGFATVAVIALTLGLGVTPWISLVLAVTFGMYGVVKKWSGSGPVVSVAAEVLILAPLVLIWLWGVHLAGWTGVVSRTGGIFGTSLSDSLILMLSGPLTAVPLILFSHATKRVTLATIGLVQYLNPTLQPYCAIVVFGEPFTIWHTFAFALIWTALAIYSVESIRQERVERKASANASLSSASVK